jgi:hypothetical protein
MAHTGEWNGQRGRVVLTAWSEASLAKIDSGMTGWGQMVGRSGGPGERALVFD